MRLPWHRDRLDTPSAAHPPAADNPRPATRGPGDGPSADDLDQQRRNTAAIAAYGRLLTGARTPQDPTADPTAGDLTGDPTGALHVCGIGLIPIAVALAAIPVDDARQRLLLDPDNQAALDDEATALAHRRHVMDEAATATTTAPSEAGTAPTPR